MAIEPRLESITEEELLGPIEVEVDEADDFGELISLEEEMGDWKGEHFANLAEHVDESDLMSIASNLVQEFEADRRSRSDWATAYAKGMDLLGMKVEERSQPWAGASGVFHPVLTEAIIKFQAQAMDELYPAAGPATTKILGKDSAEKTQQAERVKDELNYQLTEEMTEYRDETEQLLFKLAMAGSSFKKVYYDPILDRPTAVYVPAEDVVVSYGASDLMTAPRVTHVMKKTTDEVDELQDVGFYRDIELSAPNPEFTDVRQKQDELAGEEPTMVEDDRHTLLEMYVNLKLPEPFNEGQTLARPYVVTIDKTTNIVLAVKRNWKHTDKRRRKQMHLVHYKYLPGMGFYGTGLIHLLGGLTKTATSILRQLIDAGTLANLPAGLKARGLRVKGDNTPFKPGELRDVDVPGGSIRDAVTFLPFKEPSAVLYSLLGNVVDEARRIGSVADTDLSKMSGEMPVGTTFALLEREMKVMSSVQARLHASLKTELRLISSIIHTNMPSQYDYDDEQEFNRTEDFDGRVDVIPVSDPNASTAAQKVVSYQAALQLSQGAPQIYNMALLHRQMLGVLGIENADKIVQLPEDIEPTDPVTENMAILNQQPTMAFIHQDHEAHIRVHMAAMQDPKIQQIVGQSPFAQAIQSSMAAHITEHVAFEYRKQIERNLGVSLPDPEAPLPEDVEAEVSRLAAEAADKLLGKHQAEASAAQAAEQAQDPLTILQQREMSLKEQEFEHDKEVDQVKLQLEALSKIESLNISKKKIESDENQAAAKLLVSASETRQEAQSVQQREMTKIAVDIAKALTEVDEKDRAARTATKAAEKTPEVSDAGNDDGAAKAQPE